jgi:hypothetical protein
MLGQTSVQGASVSCGEVPVPWFVQYPILRRTVLFSIEEALTRDLPGRGEGKQIDAEGETYLRSGQGVTLKKRSSAAPSGRSQNSI